MLYNTNRNDKFSCDSDRFHEYIQFISTRTDHFDDKAMEFSRLNTKSYYYRYVSKSYISHRDKRKKNKKDCMETRNEVKMSIESSII
jgi:hypothetical protein